MDLVRALGQLFVRFSPTQSWSDESIAATFRPPFSSLVDENFEENNFLKISVVPRATGLGAAGGQRMLL